MDTNEAVIAVAAEENVVEQIILELSDVDLECVGGGQIGISY